MLKRSKKPEPENQIEELVRHAGSSLYIKFLRLKMECEVTVEIEIGLMKEIRDTLKELAEDLSAELNSHYPPEIRDKYPSEARRFLRDSQPVRDAYRLIKAIESCPWADDANFKDRI